MKINSKTLYAILACLILITFGLILLLGDFFKSNNDDEASPVNAEIDNEETEETELPPEEDFEEPPHDHHHAEVDVIDKDNNDISELTFEDPVKLSGFYEEEHAITMNGTFNGEKLLLWSYGYDETITYDLNTDERLVVEEFTVFQYVDPVSGLLLYTKKGESLDEQSPQSIITYDVSKKEIGQLDPGVFINDGVIFKDVFFYITQLGEYAESNKTVEVMPLSGVEDPAFFESVRDSLKGNKFDSLATDGKRLLLASTEEKKISEFTSGKEEVLQEFQKMESGEITEIKLFDVEGNNYAYTLSGDDPSQGSFAYTNIDTENRIEEALFPAEMMFIDENNLLFVDIDKLALSVFDTKNNDTYHLEKDISQVNISGDKIFFRNPDGFHYIKFSNK